MEGDGAEACAKPAGVGIPGAGPPSPPACESMDGRRLGSSEWSDIGPADA